MKDNSAQEEADITYKLAMAVTTYMETHYQEEINSNPVFRRVKERYDRVSELAGKAMEGERIDTDAIKSNEEMLVKIIDVRRQELKQMLQKKEFSDELIRTKQRELDLEEASVRK